MKLQYLIPLVVLGAGLAACADREAPTDPTPAPGASVAPPPTAEVRGDRAAAARLERLARRTARALGDPAFRAEVKAALDASPYREGKLHFQRAVGGPEGRGWGRLALASGDAASAIEDDARGAGVLELYFPVPAHRAAWTGDERLLVATAEHDGEAPVAYDVRGRRHVLDPRTPPDVPVLALVPAELDFDAPRLLDATCVDDACGGGGGGGVYYVTTTGLYMTRAEFVGDFEGWLKGSPEYEIHVMGPASPGEVETLASFQCIGEAASSPYRWDSNSKTWTGRQLLFSEAQMAAFEAVHPGRPFSVMAYEDDDAGCQIKVDRDRFQRVIGSAQTFSRDFTGAWGEKISTPDGARRVLTAAKSGFDLITALAAFIKTADDIIGIAVEDAVVGRYRAGTNWSLIADGAVTNGWLQLEIQ
jgi:hypothetical protein